MTDFTHYWSSASNDINDAAASSTPLDHTADDRFTARGVAVGDSVYVFTARRGQLFLIGKLQVGEIVYSDAAAERRLGYRPWSSSVHLIASQRTPIRLIKLPTKLVARLRFISASGCTALKFAAPGIIDRQTLRGLRVMQPHSAAELDRLLPEMRPFSRRDPSIWRSS